MAAGVGSVSDDSARARRWLTATQGLRRGAKPVGSAGPRRQGEARERLLILAAAVQPEDGGARGHARRVGVLSSRIALAIGLTTAESEIVALAGVLHDAGSLGGWTPHQCEVDDPRHAVVGAQLVVPFDVLGLAAPMIRHHHERLDGSGYPDGLRGDAIPLGSRIIAVADVYDRLTLESCAEYRDRALFRLADQAGRGLDPDMVAAICDFAPAELGASEAITTG